MDGIYKMYLFLTLSLIFSTVNVNIVLTIPNSTRFLVWLSAKLYTVPPINNTSLINIIKKLNKLLPTTFPTATLKLPILTRETHDVSSGRDVAIPNNKAPAKLAPKLSLAAIISVTYVINILENTNPKLTKINLTIICFNESDVVIAASSSPSSAEPVSYTHLTLPTKA